MLSALATLLRLASRIACLIVIVSFAIFAVEQTGEASSHQQNEVTQANGKSSSSGESKPARKSTVHKTIDEASEALTSPFSGIVTDSSSHWGKRIVETVLALLVYGLGVGYLTRVLRMRV